MNKQDIFAYIVNNLEETYKAKNADYGDSVGDTYEKFGDVAFLTRISDKYNRILSLCESNDPKVKDEKLEDTILDMANYCILWLVEKEFRNQTSKDDNLNVDVKVDKAPCNDAEVTKMMEAATASKLKKLDVNKWNLLLEIMDNMGVPYHVETVYAGPNGVKLRLVADSLSLVNRALDILNFN